MTDATKKDLEQDQAQAKTAKSLQKQVDELKADQVELRRRLGELIDEYHQQLRGNAPHNTTFLERLEALHKDLFGK